MTNWHDKLLLEYKESRNELRRIINTLDKETLEGKEDGKTLRSAMRDMDFIIKWLETGVMPEPNRNKYKVYSYKKKFVYGANGYWDESIGNFVSKSNYNDPYEEIERKIDKELEEERFAADN